MSCCGNKRAAWSPSPAQQPARRQVARTSSPLPDQKEKMWADLHFEYQGDSMLTLIGSMTGIVYHWSGKGVVHAVDYRDAGGLMHHNLLRRVK